MNELTTATQDNPFMSLVERLAEKPDIDVDKLYKIIEMQERILDRNAEQAFNYAMTQAQNKMPTIQKKKRNTQTDSNYAPLEDVLRAAKPIYTAEGFSLMFYEGETSKPNHTRVCVDIMHSQGHTKKRFADFALDKSGIKGTINKTDIHSEGSTFSYGRRYLTCMIFNIPTGDDNDGNQSSAKTITQDQVTEITDLLKEIYGEDHSRWLAWMKVESVEQIKASDYKKAINALNVAKAKKDGAK